MGAETIVADITSRNATERPEHPAIVFDGQTQTFAEHAQRVYRLANALNALGLRPPDRVAILAENCPAYLEVYAACEVAGFIACPVNFRLASPEIGDILKNIEPRALVFDSSYAGRIVDVDVELQALTLLEFDCEDPARTTSYESALAKASPEPPSERPGPGDAAYIVHTSGSTGRPKGAVLGQRAMRSIGQAIAEEAGLSVDDRGLISQPLFHVGAKFLQLAHHVCGATVCLHRGFEAGAVWEALEHDGITTMQLVPTMLSQLLDHEKGDTRCAPALRTIFYSTAPIGESLLRRGLERFGQVFLQQYGSTEAGPVSSLLKEQHSLEAAGACLSSAGRPCVGASVRIVDDEGNPCPAGRRGEIEVRHPDLMLRYWRNSDATARVFHDDWLRMGDIGVLDEEGFLTIVDRKQDMIISGGENVYPREVEAALVTHPEVQDVAVIGIPSDVWGEAVHAVVATRPGSEVTEQELIRHCRSLVAGYKLPKRIEFTDSLPRVSTGKIDKAALRRPYWAGHRRPIV